MFDFPNIEIEIGKYIQDATYWITEYFGSFLDAFSKGVLAFLMFIEKGLMWVPWWIVIAIFFLLGWRYKSIAAGLIYAALLFLIGAFGYWDLMMLTLAIVLSSVVISILVGVPIGIISSYSKRMERVLRPILDAMQTMPSFVYLIPAMMFFGLGKVPAVFATIIYALPPVIRLTNLGIQNVAPDMVEAAKSFGSSRWQVLLKVQLPQAMPTIMTGINQTTMMALSMVVIASMVGAQGLGFEVLTAINRIDIAQGFESGIAIVFLAIIIDRISQGIANKNQKFQKKV